jgi:hypothetical protein
MNFTKGTQNSGLNFFLIKGGRVKKKEFQSIIYESEWGEDQK